MMGLLFVFALFKGWRKLDPETKEETKKDTTTHDCCKDGEVQVMKEKVSQVATVFSAFVMALLPGSTNLDSPWTHWVCRRNRILLVEVSVIVQHRYHCPSCVLLLYGLWKKG